MEIFTSVIMLLAGSGVFIAGMNMMSDGLERSAGKGMKKLFARISNNRFAGVGVGAAATAIIQSSAATTVMAMGFVSAGVMTLTQATSIIMGANIGTTVTGLLVSLSAFNVPVYASVLALVGVVLCFFKKDSLKKVGAVLTGLGLVFVGLNSMSGAFSDSPLTEVFQKMFGAIDFPLLLILVGALFTALIQSSSAATGLIIIMVGSGALDPANALFIVLGTNIGTCVTAVLAAIGTTNTDVKRTAAIHLIIKIIGVTVFLIPLWIWSEQIMRGFAAIFKSEQLQIAWFHVAFNVVTTAILLPFIKHIVALSKILIKDKPKPEDNLKMKFIDDRLLKTPPIAVAQVKKEILFMASLARENLVLSAGALIGDGQPDKAKFAENEARINHTYHAVARYLIRLASLQVSEADERLIGAYHHVISDIERIGDHAENFVEQTDAMGEENLTFSTEALAELNQMYNKVLSMFDLSINVFDARDYDALPRLASIEEEIDDMKDRSGAKHIERLNSGDCAVELGTYFYAVLNALERIADHLVNIAFSIKNPTGSQSTNAAINETVKPAHSAEKRQ